MVKLLRHDPANRWFTLLRAGDTVCVVTSDHRVIVPRGNMMQTIPACHLQVGHAVICDNVERRLDEVEVCDMEIEVYEITFKPDIPIETF